MMSGEGRETGGAGEEEMDDPREGGSGQQPRTQAASRLQRMEDGRCLRRTSMRRNYILRCSLVLMRRMTVTANDLLGKARPGQALSYETLYVHNLGK